MGLVNLLYILPALIRACRHVFVQSDAQIVCMHVFTHEHRNPLDPLLKKLSEEFTDDQDLSVRLSKLFKASILVILAHART